MQCRFDDDSLRIQGENMDLLQIDGKKINSQVVCQELWCLRAQIPRNATVKHTNCTQFLCIASIPRNTAFTVRKSFMNSCWNTSYRNSSRKIGLRQMTSQSSTNLNSYPAGNEFGFGFFGLVIFSRYDRL